LATTENTLFDGRLVCSQHRDGYRFSVDSVLAAHFCRVQEKDRVLDIGCGCGVISLILCYRFPDVHVTGLELQPALAKLACSNSSANFFEDQFTVVEGDLRKVREFMQPESFDLVVSNPPYRRSGSGRVNREDECAVARHELTADLPSIVSAASFCVKNRGIVVCIYPADRLAPLVAAMLKQRLVPKRIQPVYSYPEDDRARLVMVEAVKNGGEGLHLLPPFYIYQYGDGPYTTAMEKLYQQ
jgi:tRNA1Val (adenine37-N6)-methyltransferase